jgi:hypothetical protein
MEAVSSSEIPVTYRTGRRFVLPAVTTVRIPNPARLSFNYDSKMPLLITTFLERKM